MPGLGSCRVCSHEHAKAIDAELLSPGMNKRSLRAVGGLFHLSHETLRRHYQKCLGQGSVKELTDTTQGTYTTPDKDIRISQEQITKVFELNHRAQSCGNPLQMMVITRELLDLLADMLKSNLSL